MATYREIVDKIKALHGVDASVEDILRAMVQDEQFGGTDWVAVFQDMTASTARVGDGTNYTEFESTGFQLLTGSSKYWKDIDFPINQRNAMANQPDFVTIQGNIKAPQWAVNDYLDLEGQELVHEWEEGTEVFWHLHLYTNGLDVTDRYVRFTVEYTWADNNMALTAAATIDSGDILIPANTADKTMTILSIGSFVPTDGHITAHVIPQLKRIASTGTAPTSDPWIDKLQLHIRCNSLGSRNIGTK